MADNKKNLDKLVREYTFTHQGVNSEIYLYKNDKFRFVIYKDEKCLNQYREQNLINVQKLDFGNCYNDLKSNSYINGTDNITTIILDIPRENQSSYSYYNFYNPENGEDLDYMTICNKYKVNKVVNLMSLNMNNLENKKKILAQNINIFDHSTSFFTDICFKYISPIGKDIPLKDRILDYFPNIKLCDDECINKGIDFQKYEVICECTISNLMNNYLINNYFTGEVINLIRETNLDVLKCYKFFFTFEGFKESYGGMIIITLIAIQISLNILYFKNGFAQQRKFTLGLIKSFIIYLQKESNSNSNISIISNKVSSKDNIREKNTNNICEMINNDLNIKSSSKKNNSSKTISSPPRKSKKKSTHPFTNIFNIINRPEDINASNSTNKVLENNSNNKFKTKKAFHVRKNKKIFTSKAKYNRRNFNKNINKTINIQNDYSNDIFLKYRLPEKDFLNYMKKSPDDMIFEEALINDKRNIKELFTSILIQKQAIVNIIKEDDEFRPKLLRVIIHILTIDLYFVINGFFFNESYIAELYHSQKEEKFFSFISRSFERIIYASLVTVIVNFLINCIIIDGNKIKSTLIREQKNTNIMKGEIGNILLQMQKSVKIFIVVNYFIMAFSWYYIVCFNNVYTYTKTEWFKSSIFIIILEELLPFLFSLVIAVLRFLSLTCKSEQIYKISTSL
jgi:hypothetical protein